MNKFNKGAHLWGKNTLWHLISILMRSFILLICFGLGSVYANSSYSQTRMDIEVNDVSFEEFFNEIESKSEYIFFYNDNILDNSKKISLKLRNVKLANILKKAFSNTNLEFKIDDRQVVVKKNAKEKEQVSVAPPIAATQGWAVSGVIRDNDGALLPGANIVEKGTTNGTQTDFDGNFALTVTDQNAVLIVSYIGFTTLEVAVNGQETINIVLEASASGLDEVVVVGYGTQKKANLTGSVSQVSGNDVALRPVGQTSIALQGAAPGVTVTQSSGQPGEDGGTIRIRGVGSFGGDSKNNPLIIVDGVPTNDLNNVDPNDIESVNIFKDAASAAIYGSRAANGVILVTTKRGSGEGFNINYRATIGWQEATDLIDKVGPIEHLELLNEANVNSGRNPVFSDEFINDYRANLGSDEFPDQDWQELLLSGSGFQQNHYIGVNGGTEKVKVFGSLSLLDQEAIIPETGFERYSLRFNTDIALTDKLNLKADFNFRFEDRENFNTRQGGRSNIDDTFFWANNAPRSVLALNSDGTFAPGWNNFNPYANLVGGSFFDDNRDIAFVNLNLAYDILDDWNVEVAYSPNITWRQEKQFRKETQLFNTQGEVVTSNPPNTDLFEEYSRETTTNFRVLSRYAKTLKKHDFGVLAGFEKTDFNFRFINGSRIEFPLDDFPFLDVGSPDNQSANGSETEWSLVSWFGRVTYAFDQKYLLEGNVRYDGSSRFGSGNKYGFFPSVSGAWRISEEEFFKNDVVNSLKLRASWGRLGNQNIGNNYPFASNVVLGQNYQFNGVPVTGAAILDLANRDITWETTEIINFGLDGTLFKDIGFTVEYYIKNTTDILLEIPIVSTTGLNEPFQNAAEVQNKGLDLSLDYYKQFGDFSLNIRPNFSIIKNEVVSLLGKGPFIRTFTIDQEGESINSIFGYEAEGLFQTQAEVDGHATQFGLVGPGDIKYKDQNNDGVINGDDRVILGNTIPEYTYGLNMGMGWKGFNLNVLLQGVGGVDGYIRGPGVNAFVGASTAQPWQRDGRWTPENPDPNAIYPRFTFNGNNNQQVSSFWLRSASFLRVKNVQLSYTLPSKALENTFIKGISANVGAQNLFTFDDFYTGFDPESPIGPGQHFPQLRVFTFGFDINF